MATHIIEAGARAAAENRLAEIEADLLYQAKQIRAIATAVRALLPANPFAHPAFKVTEGLSADDRARYELRDAVIAVREFASTLDHCGCVLQDAVPDQLETLRTDLGLQPSRETSHG